MTNPLEPNFNPGGIIDRMDNRDFQYKEIAGAVIPFDWNKGYDIEQKLSTELSTPNFRLKVKDQNGSFSCGGQAWAYYAEVLEAITTKSYEPRSAKYLYSQTCVPNGGSRGRDNADIFVNQGICKESILSSYENGQPPKEPFMQRSGDVSDIARIDAKLTRATAYAQAGLSIESVAIALRDNYGVVLGVDGQNNGTWSSAFPKPPTTTEWRHWVYAGKAKMINGIKYIGILNSWGSTVGDKGWQWLSEDYFMGHVFSSWTHVFAPLIIPPMFTHNFQTNINFGDTNTSEIKFLQTALRFDGEFPITVDSTGVYGDITRRAVLAFQVKYKIISSPTDSDNGRIVGPKTRTKLNSLFNVSN